jgi:DNA-binding transcriptional MerR regulator
VRIGELSEATGVSTRALRYYEHEGLITSRRRPNGYRDYDPDAVEMVALIQDLFAAGLSSGLLRDVMPCVAGDGAGTPPADLLARVEQVRDDLLRQEERLRARRETLDDYLSGRRRPARIDALVSSAEACVPDRT